MNPSRNKPENDKTGPIESKAPPVELPIELASSFGKKGPATTLRERFEQILSVHLQVFASAETEDEQRQQAVRILNIFRALFTGPLVPGYHPVDAKLDFKRALQIITKDVTLPWSILDVTNIPPDQEEEVKRLKTWLFDPERNRGAIKKAGRFGTLSIDSLEKDYLSGPDGWSAV